MIFLLSACATQKFAGSRTRIDNQFMLKYAIFNGTESSNFVLETQEQLSIEVVNTSGNVDIEVGREGYEPIYTGKSVPTSTFGLNIQESGTYTVTIVGKRAKGSVSVVKKEKEKIQEVANQQYQVQTEEEKIQDMIEKMTLEEKVAQMFVITPEALTDTEEVTMAGEVIRDSFYKYPVAGLVFFESNIKSETQFREMADLVQAYSKGRIGLPAFICTDEEGGRVNRITNRGLEGIPIIPPMYQIGAREQEKEAYNVGDTIGSYLKKFGINVDFAPVADIFSNPKNTVIGDRSFASEPETVAKMVEHEVKGLQNQKILTTLKHFPGHGNTSEDSHSGIASNRKTLEELREFEFIPFKAGIEAGAEFVMIGHIALPKVVEDGTPASLSYKMISEVLRGELGFEGIVITDAMNMGAIANTYQSSEAAVSAIQAGVDILLMPSDFKSAYDGVLEAVKKETISETMINQSLERILKLKMTRLS